MTQQPLVGWDFLITEASRSHSDTPHSIKTPLGDWSAQSRDFYLTTHTMHNRQTSMPTAGFEPAIPANERPQTYASESVTTGIG